MIQAASLETGGGWIVEHPLPEVDPDGAWYPVGQRRAGRATASPPCQAPAVPRSWPPVPPARWAGGDGRCSPCAGTLAAAGLAAALARRIDPSLARPALWVVGLASPLLFDGFLVMAHTLGAALAAAAVLAAVVAIQDRRPAMALLVAPAVAGAVLLRNEALLFAIALAAGHGPARPPSVGSVGPGAGRGGRRRHGGGRPRRPVGRADVDQRHHRRRGAATAVGVPAAGGQLRRRPGRRFRPDLAHARLRRTAGRRSSPCS